VTIDQFYLPSIVPSIPDTFCVVYHSLLPPSLQSLHLASSYSSTFVLSQSKRNVNDDSNPSCAICLEQFTDGEDICASQNKQCPHQFHLNCAFKWLLTSQECPCCRRDYLTIGPTSDRAIDKMNPTMAGTPTSAPMEPSDRPTSLTPTLTPQQILAASIGPAQSEV
jgi:Ring finger domain